MIVLHFLGIYCGFPILLELLVRVNTCSRGPDGIVLIALNVHVSNLDFNRRRAGAKGTAIYLNENNMILSSIYLFLFVLLFFWGGEGGGMGEGVIYALLLNQ